MLLLLLLLGTAVRVVVHDVVVLRGVVEDDAVEASGGERGEVSLGKAVLL